MIEHLIRVKCDTMGCDDQAEGGYDVIPKNGYKYRTTKSGRIHHHCRDCVENLLATGLGHIDNKDPHRLIASDQV